MRWPTEKGSWGILLIPFVCGAALSALNLNVLLALVSMLALFVWRGSCEAQGWTNWRSRPHLLLAGVAALAGLPLLYRRPLLLGLALGASVLYAGQMFLVRKHVGRTEKRSLPAEIIGVMLLTLSAPATWIAAAGTLNSRGAEVWLANALFFLGGILYVKYRVRGILAHRGFPLWSERLAFTWPVLVYHLLLLGFLATLVPLRYWSAAALLAFLPCVCRAFALPFQLGRAFPIRRLGWTEVGHALGFAIVLIVTF